MLVGLRSLANLKPYDQLTLHATRASEIQFQPTLHVQFKQTVVELLLALNEPVAHRAIACAALRNATSSLRAP